MPDGRQTTKFVPLDFALNFTGSSGAQLLIELRQSFDARKGTVSENHDLISRLLSINKHSLAYGCVTSEHEADIAETISRVRILKDRSNGTQCDYRLNQTLTPQK
jgi:hypothetical protein